MPSITSGYLQRVVRCKWRAFYASPATSSTTNIKHLQQNPNRVRAQKNRLKDGLFVESGAGNETRTRDPDLGKVVLYQLSYSRKSDAESGVP